MKKIIKTSLIIFMIGLLIMPKTFALYDISSVENDDESNSELFNFIEDEVDNNELNNGVLPEDSVNDLDLIDNEEDEDNLEVENKFNTETVSGVTGLQKIDGIWRMLIDGKIDYSYTGVEKNAYGTWYLENGEINFKYTGIYKDKNGTSWIVKEGKIEDITGLSKIDNIWRMVVNGKIDYGYTGTGTNDYGTWYFENGEINFKYTDTYYDKDDAYIIEEGKLLVKVSKDEIGLFKINDKWRMLEKGKINYNYTGIGTNDYGIWYLENGEINFKYTGTYKDVSGNTWVIKDGQIENITGLLKVDNVWRKIVDGKIDYNYTGEGKNDYGTWYFENGEIKLDATGMFKINNKWRMVFGGKIDISYTGIGTNEFGTWYLENGEIPLDKTQLFKIDNIWRMVENGKINYQYTGIGTNDYGTWYFENGEINFKYTDTYYDKNDAYIIEDGKLLVKVSKDEIGLFKINDKWRMVEKGKINYNYKGIGTNDYGTWYFENGEINFKYTGTYYQEEKTYIINSGEVIDTISKDTNGLIKINNVWRMVENGKINYQYKGIGKNAYGIWYFENGTINFNYMGCYKDQNGDTWVIKEGQVEDVTGMLKVNNAWRMVENGKINYQYTGIGKNAYGTWYLENGEINFKYTNTYYENEKAYIIENGEVYATVTKDTTGLLKINSVWRMVENGKVNYNYKGLGINDYGTWLFENGKINTNYSGEYTDLDGSVYNLSKGEVVEVRKNSKYPGTMWVDEPIQSNKYLAGNLNVSGWTLAEEKNDIVKVYLDGKFVGNATRKERPDVFEVYSNGEYGGKNSTPLPGYYITVNTKGLGNGSHSIKIVNYASDGKTIIQSRKIDFLITDLTKSWGIDVSRYQENIRWEEVKAKGVEFAIIRIGYYEESKGQAVIDPYFERNYNECKRLGIAVGGYYYSYAFNSAEASREAAACISAIRGKHFEMPIFLDVEDKILKNAFASGKTNKTELTNASITFCNALNNAGYRSGVYASKFFFRDYLNVSQLERYNIWLAHYTSQTDYTGRYDIWQYAEDGRIPGIDVEVDLNWCFTRYY